MNQRTEHVVQAQLCLVLHASVASQRRRLPHEQCTQLRECWALNDGVPDLVGLSLQLLENGSRQFKLWRQSSWLQGSLAGK